MKVATFMFVNFTNILNKLFAVGLFLADAQKI